MTQQIRFCTSRDGTRIAYATMGSGPTLVKTANWLSHLEYDFAGPVMGSWFETLAQAFTLVRYDERGCGLSDWDVHELSLDALVQDLEAVVDTLNLERFPLLGISQGGPVAIAYAVRHPERVSRLVLYGTYARPWMTTPEDREVMQAMLKVTGSGWGQSNPACRRLFASLLMPDATMEQLHALTELQRRSTSPENAVRLLQMCFYHLDVRALAPQISVPTLVAHSRHDSGVPFERGRELAALIPGARFLQLESHNHLLLDQEPAWQQFMDAVHHFLEPERQAADAFSELTEREREVLERIAQGLDNASIAERLFISPKTVRNHITRIFSKLEVRDRAQAIVLAREAGLGQATS